MYTAKLCNSIAKYSDTRSVLDTKNEAPIVVNTTIIGYSAIVGRTDSPLRLAVYADDAHDRRISPPTIKIKNSIAIETVLTWNNPL